jgi:hypothetical protein
LAAEEKRDPSRELHRAERTMTHVMMRSKHTTVLASFVFLPEKRGHKKKEEQNEE